LRINERAAKRQPGSFGFKRVVAEWVAKTQSSVADDADLDEAALAGVQAASIFNT